MPETRDSDVGHTALPWSYRKVLSREANPRAVWSIYANGTREHPSEVAIAALQVREENARLIVTAVNNHAALVEALRAVVDGAQTIVVGEGHMAEELSALEVDFMPSSPLFKARDLLARIDSQERTASA